MPFPEAVLRIIADLESRPSNLAEKFESDVAAFILALYDEGKVYLTASPEDSEKTVH